MSVVTDTQVRSEERFRVTRSRRNVAWTGLGALVVVVVLALFPYIVYSGTTTIMVQAFIVLTMSSICLLYTSPSPRDRTRSRMPSSA